MNLGNTILAYRIIKNLGNKWTDFDAYELGIIDKNGKLIKSPESDNEKASYDSYNRMIINLKRILQKFTGKSNLVHKLVTLTLLKEGKDVALATRICETYSLNLNESLSIAEELFCETYIKSLYNEK